MALNEQDKSDLLDLVSGFGTADSLERAARLVNAKPEAAEYLRQMKLIAAAFEPPPDVETDEGLSSEEADRLAGLVLARATNGGGPSGQRILRVPFWRMPATGAAAAAVLITLCGIWVAWMTSGSGAQRTPFGTLVFDTAGAGGAVRYEQGALVPGQIVTAKADASARVLMPDGTTMLLPHMSSMQVGQDGHSFVLRHGSLRIVAKDSATVTVEDLTITLRSGASSIRRHQSGVDCAVYKGSATISTPIDSHEMTPGQHAHWGREARTLRITPLTTPTPTWVADLLIESQTGQE